MARLCKVADNPKVKAATGATDAMTLFATFPQDVMWRVPDTTLIDFGLTFAANLGQLPDSSCAAIYGKGQATPWAQQFMAVAEAADSAISVRWADFLEAWAWATVNKAPLQRVASAAEAVSHLRAQMVAVPVRDRDALKALALKQPVNDKDACHAIRAFFVATVAGPSDRAAPAFRAFMRGLVSWPVAT
jgi:hypothetical protein